MLEIRSLGKRYRGGSLTSGGKLFAAVFLVLWYTALSGLAAADFTGALSASPVPLYSLGYLALGAVLVAAASLRERLRAA
jgi:hypothetical protein